MTPVRAEDRERATRLAAYGATWIIWGSTYLAIRIGVESIPPFLMVAVRSLAAGALLFAWGWLRGDARPTAAQWKAAAVAGALFFLLGHGGLFWAEQRIPSGLASLLVATEHFWIVLLAWAAPGGAGPGRRAAAGVALGLGGVAALTLGGSAAGGIDPAGAAAAVLCALAWGAGLLYFRGERRPASSIYASAAPLLVGGAMLLPVSVALGEPGRLRASEVTPLALGSLAYLVVFGSVIAFTALTWLTENVGPDRAASYAYVNPLVAVLLGWAFAGEALDPGVLAAGAAIVLAVVLVVTGGGEPARAGAANRRAPGRARGPRSLAPALREREA